MAEPSEKVSPEGVSKAGLRRVRDGQKVLRIRVQTPTTNTCPVGNLARNSGVLFVFPCS